MVAPPSTHPSGAVYEWVKNPWDTPLADAPIWLRSRVFHKRQVSELRNEYEAIQSKLDKLMDLLLDSAISREEHDTKRDKLKQRQIELNGQINAMTHADDGFRDAVVDTLELARNAPHLFAGSNNDGKRRLINFLFSNLQLNGQKLQYTLRKPFDLFVEAGKTGEWRTRSDSNARPSDS